MPGLVGDCHFSGHLMEFESAYKFFAFQKIPDLFVVGASGFHYNREKGESLCSRF